MPIEVFNRTEMKYMLTQEQVDELLPLLHQHMQSDKYNQAGKTYPIWNLYFDTPGDELIVKSLEKPVYKEKLRLRSYGQVALGDTVFLEIKKKFKGVVNKRRVQLTLQEAYDFIENRKEPENPDLNRQVFAEIKNLMSRYDLKPKVFISYDRLAFFEKENSDFRVTLDTNLVSRRSDLRLDFPNEGEPLLEENQWLMEAKAFKAFPLWFVHFLSEKKLYKTSFSKYGNEFQKKKVQEQEN